MDENNLDDREQAKKNAWISFSYFLGSLLAIASVCLVLTTAVFVFSANKTTGTVTQVYRSASSGQHSAVHVSVSFFSGNKRIEFSELLTFGGFREGEAVPVLFYPSNPARARLDTFWSLWNLPVVLTFLAAFAYAAAYASGNGNQPVRFPSAGFLIFNDIRARIIAGALVAAYVFLRSYFH